MQTNKSPWPMFIVLTVLFALGAFAGWYIDVNFLIQKAVI
jgi:hypothetical protein